MSVGMLGPDLAGGRWLAADRTATWEQARVVGVERAASGTVLRLRLGEVPDVLPGQYYLVRLAVDTPPGVVEQAYSLCSSPYPPSAAVEIAVREVPGGRASPVLARQVEVGDLLGMRGPFGFLTWTERDGGPIGLVGAGSGVAPLTAIVRYAAARELTAPMTLLSSSRDRWSALLGEPLEALARERAWFTLTRTVTRDPADPTVPYCRRIDAEMLAEVFTAAPSERRPHTYFVAGPGDMVIAVRALLGSLGVADCAIYSEDHA
jgi:ferredoxin-NADP reductase